LEQKLRTIDKKGTENPVINAQRRCNTAIATLTANLVAEIHFSWERYWQFFLEVSAHTSNDKENYKQLHITTGNIKLRIKEHLPPCPYITTVT